MPFTKPSITPESDDQVDAFDDLEEMIEAKRLSVAVGWIISMNRKVHDKPALQEVKRSLKSAFTGRTLDNWTTVALCTYEVVHIHVEYFQL